MTTIKDVAAAAGVSPTTVSHVLNNRGRIAEETRTKVLEVVSQLAYQANAHAQQLVTRKSRIIAIQMPNLGGTSGPALPHSDYFLDLINGAAATADSLGYALVVASSGGNASILNGFAIDGAIVVDPQGDEPVFNTHATVVTIGVPLRRSHDVLAVDNDHARAARVVFNHFVAHGRRRPALLADRTRRSYVNDVVAGYRTWADQHGATEIVVSPASLERSAIDLAFQELRAAGADAVYASSDDLALGLLDAAMRAGLRIPDDLGIASAVDSKSLLLTSPQISATNLFAFRTGATAARLLIDRLESGTGGTRTRMIPTNFVARASTAAAAVEPERS